MSIPNKKIKRRVALSEVNDDSQSNEIKANKVNNCNIEASLSEDPLVTALDYVPSTKLQKVSTNTTLTSNTDILIEIMHSGRELSNAIGIYHDDREQELRSAIQNQIKI